MFCSTDDKFSGFFDIDEVLILGLAESLEEFVKRIKSKESWETTPTTISSEYRIIDDKKVEYQIGTFDSLDEFIRKKRTLIHEIRMGAYSFDSKHKIRIHIVKDHKGAFEVEYELRSKEDIVFLIQRQIIDIVENSRKEDVFFNTYNHKALPKAGFWLAVLFGIIYFLQETIKEQSINTLSISDSVGAILVGGFIGMVPGALISTILEKANLYFGRKLFPEDTLNVASGKLVWQRARKLRSNLFWGVFVAALITLIIPIVFS